MNGAMNMIRRFLAGLFMALVFSGVANAAPAQSQYRFGAQGDLWRGSLEAACVDADQFYGPPGNNSRPSTWLTFSWHRVQCVVGAGGYIGYREGTAAKGEPAGGNSGVHRITGRIDQRSWCPATDTAPVNGQCEDVCEAGQTKVDTWISGWGPLGAESANIDNPWPPLVCDGGCIYARQGIVDESCSGTDDTANGRQEFTCQVNLESTGTECSGAEPSGPPTEPDGDPTDPGDGGGPGDGDGGGDPGDGDGDGDGDGSGDGDGDGDGDGSGTGDGQCPTGQTPDGNGNCVSTGGGTGGNGEGEGEDGGGECGIPGKPPCAVKVDETGVGDGSSVFNGLNTQVDNLPNNAAFKGAIENIRDRSDLSPQWTWTFQLPTGCTPFQLGGYNISIDVCQWQGMIHDIMSMIWAAATVWFLIALFMRAGD